MQVNVQDDARLVVLSRQGDSRATDAIVRRYRNLIHSRARSYFLIGAERDDLVQEGMIGLLKAIREFDESRLTTFSSFADVCVSRHILSAVKGAARRKHSPLNGYVSLWPSRDEGSPGTSVADALSSVETADPAEIVLAAAQAGSLEERLRGTLSRFEAKTVSLYVAGHSYCEIADMLGRPPKAVDNALQRAKRKIAAQLEPRG
ncbi:MAG: sigma-70 family RNA polymerase sigma factor [Coriobacteriia bacterium]